MKMRGSTLYLGLTMTGITLFILLLGVHPRFGGPEAARARGLREAMVAELGLTDLCLFTEAPHTRNPAVTDRHAPFQDHPAAREHFPSGTLLPPPLRLSHVGHDVD
ncbi:hypothetical protein [Desulfococcus sp.]|uniref:hypothetical protein n=1 Tax=Desulfococcus sp. TaxID=2025834 RepID=UPI0035940FA7